ncbi:PREDICTED: UDP-glycosyltransferase 92A1-like [Nicotiana attenuata]|uniref:Glycosyltransferase n=1 Tax=Nicotiana attenuata TaxID=49451 RepID=A0A2I2MND2_NICAT|nr:PREDICTED: UDP-glycosyltransferase 92A1-like [Nicotiana attenuata]AQQ16640.1 UDP-glycosyltransferase g08104 [Nicotiana attenuata]OIT39196.1 udp-glycosyltransferase 92a1 [Nicotiana attenuata]
MEKNKGTILFFPFMAQGHIIPFLTLAFKLEQKNYNIIFVNTPLNIKKLKSSLPLNSKISLLEIPFNSSQHGLPPNTENTDSLPYKLTLHFTTISSCLEPSFRNLVSNLIEKPLCIMSDFFFGWSANIAHEFGIFHVIFSGASGFGLACYYSMWLNLPHKKTRNFEFTMSDFQEAGNLEISQLSPSLLAADSNDPYTNFNWKNLHNWMNSDGIIFNTVEELDKLGLTYFRRKLKLPVWAIGPIPWPVSGKSRAGKETKEETEKCIRFLDEKEPKSVLYISFGSQSTISVSQMMELAKALDNASGVNFIWVVRPPLGFDINMEFRPEEWLPERFVQRVFDDQNRGLIVPKWAPQVEILAHKSVGAFLTHCGWNSVLESLGNGVPLLGWPIASEQFYNSKFLEQDVGVCVEVARGNNSQVKHENILEKIELVMGENDKGKEIRRNAIEVKEIIGDAIIDNEDFKGSSIKAMEDFLNAALSMKKMSNGVRTSQEDNMKKMSNDVRINGNMLKSQ